MDSNCKFCPWLLQLVPDTGRFVCPNMHCCNVMNPDLNPPFCHTCGKPMTNFSRVCNRIECGGFKNFINFDGESMPYEQLQFNPCNPLWFTEGFSNPALEQPSNPPVFQQQEQAEFCSKCRTTSLPGEKRCGCALVIPQPEEGVSVPQPPQKEAKLQLTQEQLLRKRGRPRKAPGDPKAKYTPRGQKPKAEKRPKQGRPKGSRDGPRGRVPKGEGIKSLRKAAREKAAAEAEAAAAAAD